MTPVVSGEAARNTMRKRRQGESTAAALCQQLMFFVLL